MLLPLIMQATAQVTTPPPMPADWAALAPLPYTAPPQVTRAMAQFVADEIAAKRCNLTRPADGHYIVRVDVATLVGGDGTVRKTVPRAIDCPTVEQYSAGLVIGFARANLPPHGNASGDHWYRATIIYDWGK